MTEPEWAWRTQSGHFITSADCDALAAEADAGYDPDQLTERTRPKMQITATPEEVERLWQAARKATDDPDDPDDYAEGVFDTLQALTGNSSLSVVLDALGDD